MQALAANFNAGFVACEEREVMQEFVDEGRDAGFAVFSWPSNCFSGPNRRGPIFEAHHDWLAHARSAGDRLPISSA